ncbi:MAG: hypothetical protein WC944_10440 [Candidatus Cloacimonadaceae bacterium]|nr:hypothetical protein [Candidatus Cloacimonadota bacterium]MCK9243600.1 hypothetical protein [Candidatus Cloacimonadota bacterium]
MKKFILPLMLLLFVGSLFAVESDPSEVVGYVKYDLVAGNNTLALPMMQSYAMASEVGVAIGATAVMYFDAASQEWVGAAANPFGGWNNDFSVSNGQALWVNVDAAGTFYSIGDLPAANPSYALVAGNNMIMLPLNRSDLNLASLVGDDISATAVLNFDASSQEWVSAAANPFGGWNGDFATSIGNPLWINANAAGTWPSRAAGTMSISGKARK